MTSSLSSASSFSASSISATSSALSSFIYAIESPESQKLYLLRLKQFFDFHGLSGSLEEQAAAFLRKAKDNGAHHQWVQDAIISFINYHKQRVQRKEIAAGTLNNSYYVIKLFCEMNDLDAAINWKRISRELPRTKPTANDRAPTIEEIRTLVEYPDRRIKALVYTMCASGIRLRAWQYLKWKHVEPIKNDKDEVIAAKLTVYAGEPEEYYTFITPEAYNALKDWIDFRILQGEKIDKDGDSWVMRDLWQMSDVKYGAKWGLATNPKRLQNDGIKKILNRALRVQGLRQPLTEGKRRHEWKTSHGFRKFFKTHAEQVMRPLNVELLMSHESGISDYYYRPTVREVLDDYLKAVDLLTINDHKATLQRQVAELTEKSKEEIYILKGQLAEKEREAEEAKKALAQFENKQMQFEKGVENRQKKFEEEFFERLEEERQANLEVLQHEILRLNESRLKKIKNPKERENERTALLMNADVLEEYDIE